MKRMIGLLMMMGFVVSVLSGCGGKEIEVVKATQPLTGKLIEEYEIYRDDKSNKPVKHGYYKSYYKDESYKEVGQYVEGTKEGKWVGYVKSGGLKWEENYVDGKFEGKTVAYYKSGGVEYEVNYVDGKKEGKTISYDEEGNINLVYCHERDEEVDCPEDE